MAAATVIVAQTVVLRRLAVHLRSHQHAQQASVVGRYCGEEFLLILRVPDPSSAHDACAAASRTNRCTA